MVTKRSSSTTTGISSSRTPNKRKKTSTKSTTLSSPYNGSSSFLSKLQQLRLFLNDAGGANFREEDLSKCLRQCGYHVDRAAEQLLTGQFKSSPSPKSSLTSYFKSSSLNSEVQNEIEEKNSKNSTTTVDLINDIQCSTQHTKNTPSQLPSSREKKKQRYDLGSEKTDNISTTPERKGRHLLLSKRWIVAFSTTKRGSISYGEKLNLTFGKSGPTIIRFKGRFIEGTLDQPLSHILCPLLRHESEMESTSNNCILTIQAEALMEERDIPFGGDVPLCLSVFIEDPISFFNLFTTKAALSCNSTHSQTFFKKAVSSNSISRKQSIAKKEEAAFSLLQWAQYGPSNSPNFDQKNAVNESEKTQNNESSDEKVEILDEAEFDVNVASKVPDWADNVFESKNSDSSPSVSTSLAKDSSLQDPVGFTNVTLRSYQRDALHWMLKRESEFENEDDINRDLALIADFASISKKRDSTQQFSLSTSESIKCECSPVLVSDQKRKSCLSIDGKKLSSMEHPLWEKRYLANENMTEAYAFYVNDFLSIASEKPPNPPKQCAGGILADAMGLGKTIMLISLILKAKESEVKVKAKTRNSEHKIGEARFELNCESSADDDSTCSIATVGKNVEINIEKEAASESATLVVAPLSLVSQWEDEIMSKSNLSCYVHYGDRKMKSSFGTSSLNKFDVVITSYGTLQGEYISATKQSKNLSSLKSTFLLSHNWKRVILDEAHCIKNPVTAVSKACCSLQGEKRWAVTGTPIQNSLQDIYGLLKFLKHEPWCEAAFWKATISNVVVDAQNKLGDEGNSKRIENVNDREQTEHRQSGLKVALHRVKRVIGPLILRRTKDTLDQSGQPILTLPPIDKDTVAVTLSNPERDFYDALLDRSQEVFEGFVRAGVAGKSYFAIFSLLTRLRQACDHVALTVKSRLDKLDDHAEKSEADNKNKPEQKDKNAQDISENFLQDLLSKFDQQNAGNNGKPSLFASQVARELTNKVLLESNGEEEECPICLEEVEYGDCMLTPCAHKFRKECLLSFIQKNGRKERVGKNEEYVVINCPVCNESVTVNKIISISKTSDGKIRSTLLSDLRNNSTQPGDREVNKSSSSAIKTLESALSGGGTSAKLSAVLLELEKIWKIDPRSKVLVFSQYLGFLDLLDSHLERKQIVSFRLDGSMSLKERMDVLDKFQKSDQQNCKETDSTNNHEECKRRGSVFLASMKAGGVGINLVAASSVFIVDPWWNAAIEDQCINRIHRIGQTAKVVRVRKFIVQDSVEEKILSLQRRKKDMASEILSGKEDCGAFTDSKPTLDDFKILFRR